MKILLLPIVLLTGAITYQLGAAAARKAQAESPRLLALVFASIVALSMLQLGDVVLTFTLIPYAALGITLFLLWTVRWLLAHGVIGKLRQLLRDVSALSKKEQASPPPQNPTATGGTRDRIRPTHEEN
jgi:hypothetical protein